MADGGPLDAKDEARFRREHGLRHVIRAGRPGHEIAVCRCSVALQNCAVARLLASLDVERARIVRLERALRDIVELVDDQVDCDHFGEDQHPRPNLAMLVYDRAVAGLAQLRFAESLAAAKDAARLARTRYVLPVPGLTPEKAAAARDDMQAMGERLQLAPGTVVFRKHPVEEARERAAAHSRLAAEMLLNDPEQRVRCTWDEPAARRAEYARRPHRSGTVLLIVFGLLLGGVLGLVGGTPPVSLLTFTTLAFTAQLALVLVVTKGLSR